MGLSRVSGVLLHPSSLPGRFSIGDFGPQAYEFIDFLAGSGQRLWQVLPLGPVREDGSPYATYSAFAGNPLLISPEILYQQGYLSADDLDSASRSLGRSVDAVDFKEAIRQKFRLLRKAFDNFRAHADRRDREAFENFCGENQSWVDDYALFSVLHEASGGAPWNRWDKPLAARDPGALAEARTRFQNEVESVKFRQYQFDRQWRGLRNYCRERDISVMGDLPLYLAFHSADVWTHPRLFRLDKDLNPVFVSGVPPDYFSETGQLWNNPIYNWEEMAREGFRWWIERFRNVLSCVDSVRLDHFRGFEAYWEVPAADKTAVNGRWVQAPGEALFRTVRDALGRLPFVAENLGDITPAVEELRRKFGLPGMSILQFAFGTDPQAAQFRPHNYERNIVAYSGNHDNDTTAGWWNSSANSGDSTRSEADINEERRFVQRYLNTDGRDIHWVFIRTLLASVANTVVFPLQDVLGLGSEARMNLPGTVGRNWKWRYRAEMLTAEIRHRMREMTAVYERYPAGPEVGDSDGHKKTEAAVDSRNSKALRL